MEHRRPGRRKQAVQPTDDGAAGEGSGRPDCNEMMTTGGGHRGGQVPAARVSACIATQRGSHPLCDHRGRCREGSHWFRPVSLHVDRMYCPPLLIGHDQATGLRPLTTYKLCQASLTNLASHGVSIRPDVARSGCRPARTDVEGTCPLRHQPPSHEVIGRSAGPFAVPAFGSHVHQRCFFGNPSGMFPAAPRCPGLL